MRLQERLTGNFDLTRRSQCDLMCILPLCTTTTQKLQQASRCGVQVGVEKVTLNGRIRLTLKPLMDDMPIVAAIQVSPQLWLAHMVPCKAKNASKGISHQGAHHPDLTPALFAVLHNASE